MQVIILDLCNVLLHWIMKPPSQQYQERMSACADVTLYRIYWWAVSNTNCNTFLNEMIESEILKLVYLCTKDQLPMPLMNVFSYKVTTYSTRQKNVPLKRKCSYDPLSKRFIAKGSKLWDDIPTDIKNCTHVKGFCSRLKKIMLEKYLPGITHSPFT